jgi:hypothetical protein
MPLTVALHCSMVKKPQFVALLSFLDQKHDDIPFGFNGSH